jgi:gas vesicle protein
MISELSIPSSSSTPQLPALLHTLFNHELPGLLKAGVVLEVQRIAARKIDGKIIGTGAADFTTDNTCYTLRHDAGKTFQLFDVPGIEGNEARYASMVQAAVAKAHLVIYVNGTNKKPEKATAEKIRAYLHRGTAVCPIVNVRGSADAYEFDEDRVELAQHGDCEKALAQTVEVLRGALGENMLMPGHCVQGLLGFSALAIDAAGSTIHPSRAGDLAIQQRNYLKHFGSPVRMLEFSQIQRIAGVVDAKRATFKQDIIESNKGKLRELLVESIAELTMIRQDHTAFLASVAPEFAKCRAAIVASLATFDRLLAIGRKNAWEDFFNRISGHADTIVSEYFGDDDRITSEISAAFRIQQKQAERSLDAQLGEQLKQLQDGLSQAAQRLVEDVHRVNFQQQFGMANSGTSLHFSKDELDMNLSMKDWGSIAFNIGSYAASGAAIGSFFPGIGNIIGAVAGAAVGLAVSVASLFTSKEKRVRKAQQQVQEKIDEVRNRIMEGLDEERRKISGPVHEEVRTTVRSWVDAMQANLSRAIAVIDGQIAAANKIKTQLEEMPHGTIQAI